MISVLDVAWYFVQRSSAEVSVTQLKLQKLCYYAQGFHLGIYGMPLFSESIEAWDYGPLVRELRELHCQRGAEIISPDEQPFGSEIDSIAVVDLLDRVWSRFGYYSPGRLVDMTHSEQPWIEAYSIGQNTMLSKETMQRYFMAITSDLTNDYSKTNSSEDVMSNVFLKDGKIARVPFLLVEKFLEDNQHLLDSKKIKTMRKRLVSNIL